MDNYKFSIRCMHDDNGARVTRLAEAPDAHDRYDQPRDMDTVVATAASLRDAIEVPCYVDYDSDRPWFNSNRADSTHYTGFVPHPRPRPETIVLHIMISVKDMYEGGDGPVLYGGDRIWLPFEYSYIYRVHYDAMPWDVRIRRAMNGKDLD